MSKFTPEQQKIIDIRDKNLIVSAAAGSGKTTVMIERIKDLIVKDHVSIDNFLIVTFTKASSIDMKSRLIASLQSLNPDTFILEQIDNVSTADVSNLHSFCARLLKSYFYVAELDPTFVVLSDEESDLLKQKALNKLFDQEFENNNHDFFVLYDCLQKNRSDKSLKEHILKLYDFFNVTFDIDSWFSASNNLYDTNLGKNRACNIINSYVCSRIKKILTVVDCKIKEFKNLQLLPLVVYLEDVYLQLCKVNFNNGFIKNAEFIYQMPTFGVPPKVDEAMNIYRQQLDQLRQQINSEVKNFKANYVTNDTNQLCLELSESKTLAEALFYATTRFSAIYSDLKREKCGLDYNDLEQYTLKVLSDAQTLNTIKQKYKYIFVDEYQDINAIQEKIISLLSSDNNRFMVGDIKQSIYRFRLCDPDIFLDKYNKYKNQENSEAIDLSKNFRSNKEILNFVNMAFDDRMTTEFGGVDYKNTAKLVAGSNFEEDNPVNLTYIDTTSLKENKNFSGNTEVGRVYSVKNHQQTEELENLKSMAEAEYIASEILDLVANGTVYDNKTNQKRNIRFNDIAILLPARNNFLDSLLEVFGKYNIPTSSDVMVDVLSERHVKAIYNFLKLIYNYKQDIELFSCLYSPLSGFTLDELANLRITNGDYKYFYQCLENAKLSELDCILAQKVQNFRQTLAKYKKMAGYKTVKEVAHCIIQDFEIQNLMLTEPDAIKRINLLNKFLDSLNNVSIYEYFADGVLTNINASGGENTSAVQIVTIHKSKGLEYSIVFCPNISRNFNMQGMHGDVLISKELGLAVNYFNPSLRTKNNTIAKEAIKLTETRKLIEEQQRLLYVALTRAINKLYVVGTCQFSDIKADFPERANSFADWFDSFVYNYLQGNNTKNVNIKTIDSSILVGASCTIKSPQVFFGVAEEQLKQQILDNINFKYKFDQSTKTPQKTSVTQIASGYHESEEVYLKYNNLDNASTIEKGNAYHKLMESIDFSCNNTEKLNKLLQSLLNAGKLTQNEINYINKDSILKLLNNPTFLDIINFGTTLREKEFFINFGTTDIQIVQGVVDLAVINNDKALVIDYKTGNFLNSQNLQKYKTQLNIYKDAIQKSYNVEVIKCAIVAVEQGEVYFL